MQQIEKHLALNAVTATTVSDPINVKYAKKITLLFERASHVSGGAVFSIQASVDGKDSGADFVPYVNMISNDVNNHVQTLERNRTVELTADGKTITALDLEHFVYDYIQVKVVESGSGTSTCKLLISA
jgi:hypothetical protein